MSRTNICPGQVVRSIAGRDQGRSFIVIDIIDDRHVTIADGVMRKTSNPKKKNARHLLIEDIVAEEVATKLRNSQSVTDKDVRRALASLGRLQEATAEGDAAATSLRFSSKGVE